MSSFFQDAPGTPDLFTDDHALKSELARRLPTEILARVTPKLERMGRHTATTLPPLVRAAEAEPPVHVPYDPWGRRVDEIRVSRAWETLKEFSATEGIVATGYDASLGEHSRVAQAALLHLFAASSATFSCPLAMTDAAARVLLDLAPRSLRDRLAPRLITTDPAKFITSGQWMTERTGGSDVGPTSTFARPIARRGEENRYTLHGVKWFTSATTSEMALTLARVDDGNTLVEGSRGLSLFAVEVDRIPGGALRGIQVNRLKDKLGTWALPTAELTLDGVEATRIGEQGRGVASITPMLSITRFYNAVCAVSGMSHATALAFDYADRRVAFGKKLREQPLHAETLAEMRAEVSAALALVMEIAALMGRAEQGIATADEKQRLRGLIPIAKLTTGKQAVSIASEALEAFGGAGYVEDTGLPRLLRDAQVLTIWEGTTNVLSLDLLRAEAKDGALTAILTDLSARAEALPSTIPPRAATAMRATLGRLVTRLTALAKDPQGGIERDARRVALTTGHLVEAFCLADRAAKDDLAAADLTRFTRAKLSAPLD